jgi:hypothetical protein
MSIFFMSWFKARVYIKRGQILSCTDSCRVPANSSHIFRWQPYPLRYAFEYRRDTSRIQRPTNLVSAYLPTIRGTSCSCSSGRCVMFKMAREIEYRSSKPSRVTKYRFFR